MIILKIKNYKVFSSDVLEFIFQALYPPAFFVICHNW